MCIRSFRAVYLRELILRVGVWVLEAAGVSIAFGLRVAMESCGGGGVCAGDRL